MSVSHSGAFNDKLCKVRPFRARYFQARKPDTFRVAYISNASAGLLHAALCDASTQLDRCALMSLLLHDAGSADN
jgi:hypothetical protein